SSMVITCRNMAESFTIWCNATLSVAAIELLRQNLGRHRLAIAKADSDPSLQEAEIAFGQPDPQQVIASERIKWVHLSGAGYTRYDSSAFRASIQSRGVIVTNSSSVYRVP